MRGWKGAKRCGCVEVNGSRERGREGAEGDLDHRTRKVRGKGKEGGWEGKGRRPPLVGHMSCRCAGVGVLRQPAWACVYRKTASAR